jgi:predicted DsbA family dithiol-disulfide isomerase
MGPTRNRVLSVLFGVLIACIVPCRGRAQTPACNGLDAAKRALATSIMQSQHPYDCCDGTIAECLAAKPVCKLARRMADQVCRLAGAGQDQATIERALARRATTMTSTSVVPIDLSRAERAGAEDAKVTLVAYVCARCPYCAKLMPRLHSAIVEGPLQGKVKAYVREFPIRNHPFSTEGGMAMVAARRLGKGWPFLLHMYKVFDRFDPAKLPDCATQYGMDRDRFAQLLQDAEVRRELLESKKEGVRNHVEATPTLFIDGRLYRADLDYDTVVDVLQEEHDRLTGNLHE